MSILSADKAIKVELTITWEIVFQTEVLTIVECEPLFIAKRYGKVHSQVAIKAASSHKFSSFPV